MNLSYRPLRTRPLFADFGRMLDSVDNEERSYRWSPAAEVTRTDAGYRIELDVPGVKADGIDISIDDKVLTISGQRDSFAEAESVVRSERLHGAFQRSFTLSDDIDAESISAQYTDGVLVLELARKASVQPRKIEIAVAD